MVKKGIVLCVRLNREEAAIIDSLLELYHVKGSSFSERFRGLLHALDHDV